MLRRLAEKILINSLTDKTVINDPASDFVVIQGVQFPKVQVLPPGTDYCLVACSRECTPKIQEVTVDLPASPCGCIEEWSLIVQYKIKGSFDLKDIRPIRRVYTYDTPPNHTPTNDEIAAFIASAIAADKDILLEVIYVDGEESFQLKSKECQNFEVFLVSGMGTVTTENVFVPAVLTDEDMSKLFPIQVGHFASRPNLPICGHYCKYVLKTSGITQDLAHSLGYIFYNHDFEFYVNFDDPNYEAFWLDKMSALGCNEPANCDITVTSSNDYPITRLIVDFTPDGTVVPNVSAVVTANAAGDANADHIGVVTAELGQVTIALTDMEVGDEITYSISFPGCPPITGTHTLA